MTTSTNAVTFWVVTERFEEERGSVVWKTAYRTAAEALAAVAEHDRQCCEDNDEPYQDPNWELNDEPDGGNYQEFWSEETLTVYTLDRVTLA